MSEKMGVKIHCTSEIPGIQVFRKKLQIIFKLQGLLLIIVKYMTQVRKPIHTLKLTTR